MKYLFVGIAILLLCLALCLTSSLLLRRYTEETAALLEQAQAAGDAGDFSAAAALSQSAMELWQSHHGFFGTALHHNEADEADTTFRQLCRYAENGSVEEFTPTCSGLIEKIRHIAETEWPHYYNILCFFPAERG